MSLRDQINPEYVSGDERSEDEKITIYLRENSSWIEVAAHHDKVFPFLRNVVDIFSDLADKIDCDRWEKLCLLNDWLDTLKDVKDKWFNDLEMDGEDESD